MNALDLYNTYSFLKRLVAPFNKWKAYKLGIIDEKGNQLKHRSSLKTTEEKEAFGYLDILVLNLKKILAKVPGGASTLGLHAAALLLLKQQLKVQKEDESLFDDLPDLMEACLLEANQFLTEDGAPTNAVGGGQVAGTVGDPPITQKSKYKRKNEEQTRQMLQGVQAALVRRSKP